MSATACPDREQLEAYASGRLSQDLVDRLADIPERRDDAADSPEAITENAALVRQALNMIRGDFQEQTWRAFLRTAVDGRPAPEVAAELGMTKRAVRQAKYRVLQRLREEFDNLID
jgi:RNA polymerase sigma-70 factor (ECF subfamily)